VRVVLQRTEARAPQSSTFAAPDGSLNRATCWRGADARKEELDVYFADVQPELATRRAGILESTVLQDKTALFIGLGTGGVHAAIELSKSGVAALPWSIATGCPSGTLSAIPAVFHKSDALRSMSSAT
jgi:hypothetical protein